MPKRITKTTLFFKISLRLIFPLCLLIAAFTGIQLSNQLNFLNRVYEIQARISLQGMEEVLTKTLEIPTHFEDSDLLKKELEKAKQTHRVAELLVLDPLTREVLFSDRAEEGFTPQDLLASEKALLDKREGKPPVLLIDKEAQELSVFLPITSELQQKVFVAKLGFPLGSLTLAFKKSIGTLIAMFFFTLLAGFLIAGALSHSIVKPIQTLNKATRDIVKGELGQKVTIYTGDEIEELADTFNQMSVALKEMQARAEDANPLTGLPGNHGIYYEVQKRIYEKQRFVFFHVDLDRFKIFNDHYGLARGDDVIRKTAKLLRETLNEKGAEGDFLGHQGGDDFVIITQPVRAQAIAETAIQKFDDLVRTLYRKEDYEKGYILAEDRRAAETPGAPKSLVKFPLLAVSLAGITNTRRDFTDYFDLLSRAVSVKKEVKATVESCWRIVE
jgi:diguanylate cyclase (GGDEF)-like protein